MLICSLSFIKNSVWSLLFDLHCIAHIFSCFVFFFAIWLCVCVCMCVYVYPYIYISMYIFAYTCFHICIWDTINCQNMCLSTIYIYIYTHTHIHTHTHIYIMSWHIMLNFGATLSFFITAVIQMSIIFLIRLIKLNGNYVLLSVIAYWNVAISYFLAETIKLSPSSLCLSEMIVKLNVTVFPINVHNHWVTYYWTFIVSSAENMSITNSTFCW